MGFTIFTGLTDIGLSTGAAATGEGAVATLGATALGAGVTAGLGAALSRRASIPPSPVIPQAQQNEEAQQATVSAQQRASIAGGIQGTTGTAGGEAGAMLNPANMGQKVLLGQ